MPKPAILTQNLVKEYRGSGPTPVRALDGLSLSVKTGEIFGLLGRNGAGKTTLLRVLTTLVPPTSGSARVMDHDVVSEALEVRRSICAVLQENAVELFLSVADNLATFARFHGMPHTEIRPRIERVLDQFGLLEHRSTKVIDLSGGLKRRVQVAKVFMIEKPVVFLDEATTGMDPVNKRATMDAIRQEARRGRTIFLTTHILQEAEELCDTIAIIDRGVLLAQGDLRMVRSLSARAFDMHITFEQVTEDLLEELRRLPLLKLDHDHDSVELCVKGKEMSALSILQNLATRFPIVSFEVGGATLEEVFIELLEREGRSGMNRGDRQ